MFEVWRVFVGGGVDTDGFDFEFLAGPHDAEGDFASVGDEDALEHVVDLCGRNEVCGVEGGLLNSGDC